MVYAWEKTGQDASDEGEVPSLLLHRVAPADALAISLVHGSVVDVPEVFEKFADAAKGAEVGSISKTIATFLEHGSERGCGGGGCARDEKWPDEGTVEAFRSGGNEVHELGELGD